MPLPDVVAMRTRQPNLEGAGEIPLRRLVKEALRMRPSRIVVGEVRQEECLELTLPERTPTGVHGRDPAGAMVRCPPAWTATVATCPGPPGAELSVDVAQDWRGALAAPSVVLLLRDDVEPGGRSDDG